MKGPDLTPMSPKDEWQTVLSISLVPRGLCMLPALSLAINTLLLSNQFHRSDKITSDTHRGHLMPGVEPTV